MQNKTTEKTLEKKIFKMMKRSESTSEWKKEDSAHDGCDQDSSIHTRTIQKAPQAKKRRKKIGSSRLTEATEKIQTYNITHWIETQRNLKWRQAMHCEERWARRAAERNPGLMISTRTQGKATRRTRRWEDDLNEFVKEERTETTQSNDLRNSKRSRMEKERKTTRSAKY